MIELGVLAENSRKFGSDPAYVFLGGGNTSYKDETRLYIKPSGVALSAILPGQFVVMDRAAIREIFTAALPEDAWDRERRVKDMMAAAVVPLGVGRPSVEAPLHEAISYNYVFHMHPALVNGMTCAIDGAAVCAELFPDALWVEYIDPGATLAREVAGRLAEFDTAGKAQPQVIFLQNHGVFVGADSVEEIDELYAAIMARLAKAYGKAGVATTLGSGQIENAAVLDIAPRVRGWLATEHAMPVVHASSWFEVAHGPLTPDHIVYAKSFAIEETPTEALIQDYFGKHGFAAKVMVAGGDAVLTVDSTLKDAKATLVAARDAGLVQQLTRAFGGPRYLSDHERSFIENWEVESYRRQVAAGAGGRQRMAGKVCVVTGAAQGFGQGIARGLVENGAVVAIADMNTAGAEAAVQELVGKYGSDCAFAVAVNIADEDSVRQMAEAVVGICGGIDVLVANAGVLRAGSVKELSKRDWDLVTNVNYTGYFLCVKHTARFMAVQNEAAGRLLWSDIIQINSKSGLEGSNKNGAYSGGKFGGIGLTQSFAKELVEDCIKVNSICPGNFFDGPLWSDPEKGLFRQYLDTGKVPGATSLADVQKFYEAKVPMRRGCLSEDVLKAIMYVVEQQYETGQAVPVTGGQVMLS